MQPCPFLVYGQLLLLLTLPTSRAGCFRPERVGIQMDIREDETISVEPAGILWIEGHELVEEHVGDWGATHRSTRVS